MGLRWWILRAIRTLVFSRLRLRPQFFRWVHLSYHQILFLQHLFRLQEEKWVGIVKKRIWAAMIWNLQLLIRLVQDPWGLGYQQSLREWKRNMTRAAPKRLKISAKSQRFDTVRYCMDMTFNSFRSNKQMTPLHGFDLIKPISMLHSQLIAVQCLLLLY